MRTPAAEYLHLCLMVDRHIRTGRGGAFLRAVAERRPDLWADARDYAVDAAMEMLDEQQTKGGSA